MAALTISDAAKAIGHASRSQLYRLIQDGRLDDFVRHENGRRLIEVNGLAAAVREATQQRSNSVTVTEAAEPVNWDAIAVRCNGWLDPEVWGKPPWNATRWATLYQCLLEAFAAAERAAALQKPDSD
jgi:hypothetical protein